MRHGLPNGLKHDRRHGFTMERNTVCPTVRARAGVNVRPPLFPPNGQWGGPYPFLSVVFTMAYAMVYTMLLIMTSATLWHTPMTLMVCEYVMTSPVGCRVVIGSPMGSPAE